MPYFITHPSNLQQPQIMLWDNKSAILGYISIPNFPLMWWDTEGDLHWLLICLPACYLMYLSLGLTYSRVAHLERKYVYFFLLITPSLPSFRWMCEKSSSTRNWVTFLVVRGADRRGIMPECHIVNYSSLANPSRLMNSLEINKNAPQSHPNQERYLKVGLCH